MMRSARLQMTIKHRNVLRVLTVLETGPWPCILLEVAEMGDVSKWQVVPLPLPLPLPLCPPPPRPHKAQKTRPPPPSPVWPRM